MAATEVSTASAVRLGALFGAGRSGTTWLGAIVSSHPAVAYRFEPFRRLRERDVGTIAERVESGRGEPADVARLYDALLPADPSCDKPPFFPKVDGAASRLDSARRFLWPVCRRGSLGAAVYSRLFQPRGRPQLVFKEVGRVDLMVQLLAWGVPTVYLLRHPCAVVWSILRGQERNLMPSGRRNALEGILRERRPDLHAEFGERLGELTVAQQEALLWRTDVETCLDAIEGDGGLVLVYEDLVANTHGCAERVLAHLGLDLPAQTLEFLDRSTGAGDQARRGARGEVGIDPYFSVYRDPARVSQAWRQDMPADAVRDVLSVVRDSSAFALGRETAGWGES